MTRRRWLIALPLLAVLLVGAGLGLRVRPTHPAHERTGNAIATATGPDAPAAELQPSVSADVHPTDPAFLDQNDWEVELARQQEWAEAVVAGYAMLRRQDQALAEDVIHRWGPDQLLLALPSIDVTAAVAPMGLERDGRTPATPSTPWGVGWYTFTDEPGTGGNAVFSGHVDWYTGAPAVFARLKQLQVDDPIYVIQADGNPVFYQVAWTQWVDPDTADLNAIFGPTGQEAVTFITCGGTWNAVTHDYSNRLIVRAIRVR
jgi:LPXTG-site transpeptidase (sortase) family protein